ncbi:DUF2283 domain-containing protein [Arthrobacter sp. HLT1-21]
MKITYDKQADAAYVMIAHRIRDWESGTQVHEIATPGGHGEIALDFDSQGRLLGVEVLGAGRVLPAGVLAEAEPNQDTEPAQDTI